MARKNSIDGEVVRFMAHVLAVKKNTDELRQLFPSSVEWLAKEIDFHSIDQASEIVTNALEDDKDQSRARADCHARRQR